jgi:plastocyanin
MHSTFCIIIIIQHHTTTTTTSFYQQAFISFIIINLINSTFFTTTITTLLIIRMFFTKTLTTAAIVAAAVIGVSAAPTPTTNENASSTVTLTGVTHSVVAGLAGQLIFDPDNVVADPGDIVEWHFLPKNHSVAQSSFGAPCVPDAAVNTPFFSGFMPIATGQAADVFQIVVEDRNPIWYYCAQTTGAHCQHAMAGVINQNFNSPNTLAAYKLAAAKTKVSVIPPAIQGGIVEPNPNPLSGFN